MKKVVLALLLYTLLILMSIFEQKHLMMIIMIKTQFIGISVVKPNIVYVVTYGTVQR